MAAATSIATSAAKTESIDDFKRRTLAKLGDLRCPDHNQTPRLSFRGSTLRDVSIQMSACCDKLADLANKRIADGAPATADSSRE